MSNGDTTALFLNATDKKVRNEILANIATHYGITPDQALEEVTGEEAEHLLDYVTGGMRGATQVLMARRGFLNGGI